MRLSAPSSPRAISRALEWTIDLPAAHAWILVLLCLDLAALGDLATGTQLWFGPPYLLVMCLAAWSLGWRAGFVIGLSCIGLTLAFNGVQLYPNGTAGLIANFAARLIAITIVLGIVSGARHAYLREWSRARLDPLTGAFNRQAFFELGAELARNGGWRALFYADLDGLKRINDKYGHAAGDVALCSYAEMVRRHIRRDDLFARVGGDEFLIFMAIKDRKSAVAIADRLHAQMNSVPLPYGGSSRCSLGALIVAPGERSLDWLVRLADSAMYRAKERGGAFELEILDGPDGSVAGGRGRSEARNARAAKPPQAPVAFASLAPRSSGGGDRREQRVNLGVKAQDHLRSAMDALAGRTSRQG